LKRLYSILLLLAFLYDTMGHYVVFAIRQAELKREFLKLKKVVAAEDLQVLKVPVLLYHQADRDIETTEGQFEYKDTLFQMVKQRLKNDTLYVYCHKYKKTQVIHTDLAKSIKDRLIDIKEHSGNHKNPLKNYTKIFVPHTDFALVAITQPLEVRVSIATSAIDFSSVKPEIDSPPPELG
jgi:hypothetical protein